MKPNYNKRIYDGEIGKMSTTIEHKETELKRMKAINLQLQKQIEENLPQNYMNQMKQYQDEIEEKTKNENMLKDQLSQKRIRNSTIEITMSILSIKSE